jgi:HD superfamily phosphohydrolase
MATSNKLKIINDPVYGFINIPSEDIYDLMQSEYVQRLRRIKQLGLSNLVYPGAEHTRFSHSVGAMHLMKEALDVLRNKGEEINDEEYNATLQAILLHDIGHSPFSHCLESFFFNQTHEELSQIFMQELGVKDIVIAIFTNDYKKHFLHQLVSSQVDTDRLDYLTRDSFFTGVSEGVIGTERILKMFSVKKDELVIDEKGIYSIEKFIISRRLMYWQVYMHKTVVGADCMMRKILQRARFLAQNDDLDIENYPITSHLYYFLKQGKRDITDKEALNHFILLDDTDIWSSIKVWSKHKDFILSFLATNLMNRNLGKVKIKTTPFTENELKEKHDILLKKYENESKNYFTESKKEKNDIIEYFSFTDELHNKAYNFNDQKINILFKNGEVKEIYNASDQLDKNFLSKEIKKYYYFEI